jgi:O-6-methylguanine DNA methyltransferase
MKQLYVHQFETEIGWFNLASSEKGLAIIDFPLKKSSHFGKLLKKHFGDYEIQKGGTENKKAEKQIKAYLSGKLKKFSLKIDLMGTAFQKKALMRVAQIPYGKVTTYGEIASRIGNPKGARAVGAANSHNLLPIVIPCHRVVASNGLGGYAGGLKLKKQLLQIEGITI